MTRDNRLLAFSLMLWGFGEGLFWYIQPLYLRQLGADSVQIGSILAVAAIAAAIAHTPAGYLADRFGRKTVMVVGWFIGVFSSLGMYLAPNLLWFTIAWIGYVFTAFVLAPINAYATAGRGTQSVQRALTLVGAGFWIGNLTAPVIGGWVGQTFGLRTIYLLAVVAFVLSTLVILGLRPQAIPTTEHRQTQHAGLFRHRVFLGYVALLFISVLAIQLGLPFAPNFAEDRRGLDVGWIGTLGSLNSLSIVILNLTLGQWSPKRGILIGQGLMLGSMLALLGLAHPAGMGVAYLLRGGWNLALTMSRAHVGRLVSATESGLAYGLAETAIQCALALAPFIVGLLYAVVPELPFQVSAVAIVITMPLMWWLAPKPTAEEASQSL